MALDLTAVDSERRSLPWWRDSRSLLTAYQIMIYYILTIVAGCIAASALIIAKKPDAKQLFDKIAPYQGFLGVGMLVLGVFWLIDILPAMDVLFSAPLTGIIVVGAIALNIGLGILLGYGLLNRWFLSKNEAARAKGADLLAKLAAVQVPMGLAAIVVGVLGLVR